MCANIYTNICSNMCTKMYRKKRIRVPLTPGAWVRDGCAYCACFLWPDFCCRQYLFFREKPLATLFPIVPVIIESREYPGAGKGVDRPSPLELEKGMGFPCLCPRERRAVRLRRFSAATFIP